MAISTDTTPITYGPYGLTHMREGVQKVLSTATKFDPRSFSIFKAQNGYVLTTRPLNPASGELWTDIISDSLVFNSIDELMTGIEMVVLGLYGEKEDSNQSR